MKQKNATYSEDNSHTSLVFQAVTHLHKIFEISVMKNQEKNNTNKDEQDKEIGDISHLRSIQEKNLENLEKIIEQMQKKNQKDSNYLKNAFLTAVRDSTFEDVFFIMEILRDFPPIKGMSKEILKEIKNPHNDQTLRFNFLFLYEQLFYLGYTPPITQKDVFEQFGIDEEDFRNYLKNQAHTMKFSHEIVSNSNMEGYPPNSTELWKIIEEITPLSKDAPFLQLDLSNLSKSKSKSKNKIHLPLQKLLKILDEIMENEEKIKNFAKEMDSFEDRVSNPNAKKLARWIQARLNDEHPRGLLKEFQKFNKWEKDNPFIYYYKAEVYHSMQYLEDNPKQYSSQMISCLVKAIELGFAQGTVRFEMYHNLAISLQVGGYYYSSQAIILSLLRFMPWDVQLNIIHAFCLYQTLKPFKIYLYRALFADIYRTCNFLTNFWIYERIKPQDSKKTIEFCKSLIPEWEEIVTEQLAAFYTKYGLDSLSEQMELLGPKFPYAEAMGFDPFATPEGFQFLGDFITDYKNTLNIPDAFLDELDDEEDLIWERYDKWVEDIETKWEKSKYYASLPKYTWKVRDEIPLHVTEGMFKEYEILPNEWEWEDLKDWMAFDYPFQIEAPQYYWKSVGRVLQNFCEFLSKKQGYENLKSFKENLKEINTLMKHQFGF